ncbi:hypothetical protein [Nonomuraea cavernae]|uniref:Uncharacterized protein n=1 Tax=Nonomuraea cavernae TaxID=2045107 RepID=A0A917YPY6_9ACTN|nr:hypothetical protein [Nonomuraea cavernae]MCA2184726.1 hypothetical protein [Nonomuraea cavernae]GGO62941.1 hypothetical protein GCM10012289_08690 [Nonomuraea cavernae]
MTGSSSPKVPKHLLDLAGRFFDAGWSHGDVLHALNNSPDGPQAVWGDPMRWEVAKARLRLWMDESMRPILSRSQQVARANSARMRAQALARAELGDARRRASPDPEAAAARARAIVARVLPTVAEPLAGRAPKVGSRADRERWRRLDEAAAAAVEAGAVAEVWEPEPEPVVDAGEEARLRAMRRARWERTNRKGEPGTG